VSGLYTQAKKSNPLAARKPLIAFQIIAAGDPNLNPGFRLALETAPAFPVFPPSMAVTPE
jgi:hypothetical protein